MLPANSARSRLAATRRPSRSSPSAFDSANYPSSFVDCVAAIVDRHDARVAWISPGLVLIQREKR